MKGCFKSLMSSEMILLFRFVGLEWRRGTWHITQLRDKKVNLSTTVVVGEGQSCKKVKHLHQRLFEDPKIYTKSA